MHEEMPKIPGRGAQQCAFNRERRCNAVAITVGDKAGCAGCDTETARNLKAGIAGLDGEVGACKKEDCEYNQSLECRAAPGIRVDTHEGHADCATHEPRKKDSGGSI